MGLQIIQIVFNTGRKRIISFCTIHRKLKWTQRKEILNSCCVFKMRYSGTWICNEFQIASTTRTLNFHILFCLSSNNCTLNKSFGTNETSKCHFPLLFGSSSEKTQLTFYLITAKSYSVFPFVFMHDKHEGKMNIKDTISLLTLGMIHLQHLLKDKQNTHSAIKETNMWALCHLTCYVQHVKTSSRY